MNGNYGPQQPFLTYIYIYMIVGVENKFRPINQNFIDKCISYIAKANELKLWTITTFSDFEIRALNM